MAPAVALRHPDHFLAVGDVVAELPARVGDVAIRRPVVEEGRRLLVDHDARRATLGVDLDDAIGLMSALVVLERERAAILAPLETRELVGVGKRCRSTCTARAAAT